MARPQHKRLLNVDNPELRAYFNALETCLTGFERISNIAHDGDGPKARITKIRDEARMLAMHVERILDKYGDAE